jgi:hypothetical protein
VGYVGWSMVSAWTKGSVIYAPATDAGIRMRVRLFTTTAPR